MVIKHLLTGMILQVAVGGQPKTQEMNTDNWSVSKCVCFCFVFFWHEIMLWVLWAIDCTNDSCSEPYMCHAGFDEIS